jgi:HSP20 family protein
MDSFDDDREKRKRKPFDFFDIDEDDFERIFEEARRMIEDMFRSGFPSKSFEPGKPIIHGFKINIGPDGKPRITEFGNRAVKTQDGLPVISDEREPLTDIIEGDDEVAITVELPGVEREDIDLKATENSLEIKVDTPQRKYHKIVELPCGVKPKTTKATYKNGVLDVIIQRKEKKRGDEGYKVNIE